MAQFESQKSVAIYLSRYRIAKAEVKDVEQRIDRARAEMMGVKGISYEGGDMPSGTRIVDLSDYIVRIEDLIHEWQKAQVHAIETMRDISVMINTVTHDYARRVLMLYYIDGYTCEEIAEMIPCGIASVYRWRRIGLKALKDDSK